jgi:ubiquinone/menaquinone biosynthesis C-methylase UbiE
MPFVPSPVERLALLRLNAGPAGMLDVLGAVSLRAALTAKDLGVIDSLQGGAKTTTELADELGLEGDALEALLDLLVSTRYLRRKGSSHRLTSGTRKWLTSESSNDMSSFLRWWDRLVLPYWGTHLGRIVDGTVEGHLYEWVSGQPDGWAIAQEGFEAAARLVMPAFTRAFPMPGGDAQLLDAGGGHGLYSIELCRKNPRLRAVVYDSPEALGRARDNIVASGLENRVRVRPGDLTTDDLEGPFDAVLLANVIHGFAAQTNVDILNKVHGALASGGRVVILDQFKRAPGRLGRALDSVLQVGYRAIGEGRTYDPDTVKSWLETAGFQDVDHTGLRSAPGNGLISAVRR